MITECVHAVSTRFAPSANLSLSAQNLVLALSQLCSTKGWELNVVHAERLSREEQVQMAAKTTVGTHRIQKSVLLQMC